MFRTLGLAIASTCLTFVSPAALAAGVPEKLGLKRRAVAEKTPAPLPNAALCTMTTCR
ncbi:MAG TPA: hypothetical protein VHN38_07015 [Immundisolibacter sp.]|nr:hypothetical protein [Immundisolibacter sp.]